MSAGGAAAGIQVRWISAEPFGVGGEPAHEGAGVECSVNGCGVVGRAHAVLRQQDNPTLPRQMCRIGCKLPGRTLPPAAAEEENHRVADIDARFRRFVDLDVQCAAVIQNAPGFNPGWGKFGVACELFRGAVDTHGMMVCKSMESRVYRLDARPAMSGAA